MRKHEPTKGICRECGNEFTGCTCDSEPDMCINCFKPRTARAIEQWSDEMKEDPGITIARIIEIFEANGLREKAALDYIKIYILVRVLKRFAHVPPASLLSEQSCPNLKDK